MTDFLDHLVRRTLGLSQPLRRPVPVVVPAAEPDLLLEPEWPGTTRPAETGSASPAVAVKPGHEGHPHGQEVHEGAPHDITRSAAQRVVALEEAGTGAPPLPVAEPGVGPTPVAVPAAPARRAGRDVARPRPARAAEPERRTAPAPPRPTPAGDAGAERPAPVPSAVGDHQAPDPVRADVADVPGRPAEVPVAPESREVIVAEQSSPPEAVVTREFTPVPVAPNVTVTIGTVVVRPAVATTVTPVTPAPARARPAPTRSMSLEDYLSTREGT